MMVFKFHHNGMGTKLGWLRSKNDYRKMVHQSAISWQTWWECSGHGLAILSRDHSTSMCLPACISVMSEKKKKRRKLLNFFIRRFSLWFVSYHLSLVSSEDCLWPVMWPENGQKPDKKVCAPTSKESSCVTEWGLWLTSLCMFVV